ncbi:MAG TPA: hypothetical protein VM715_04065 [Candidatus Acidoferrum sp.]|nr:hypothetical protein [Candidatus Acidoferrum sp.]
MSKFFLGVAVGYVFHNAIDRVVHMATVTVDQKTKEAEASTERNETTTA